VGGFFCVCVCVCVVVKLYRLMSIVLTLAHLLPQSKGKFKLFSGRLNSGVSQAWELLTLDGYDLIKCTIVVITYCLVHLSLSLK